MRKRGRKLCALLLGAAMLGSVFPVGMMDVSAAEETGKAGDAGTENTQSESVEKKTTATIEDTFAEGELGPEWFGKSSEGVECTTGNLKLSDNNNSAAIVKRNVGNGDFEAEIHWKDFTASESNGNACMLFHINDGSDDDSNFVQIQRFSSGKLALLLRINGKDKTFNDTYGKSFKAKEGWFKIGYKSDTKQITAMYKTVGEASDAADNKPEYTPLVGNGTVMENFGGKHVLSLSTQAWSGSSVSVNIKQVNSTFVKQAEYKHSEKVDFTEPKLGDDWYGQTEGVTYEGNGKLVLSNVGDGIATVKKNVGDQDFSVESKWSGFQSDETGSAFLRVSQNSSKENFAQIARNGDGNLCFTVVEGGNTILEKTVAYSEAYGWFRLDFNHKTQEVDAYYRTSDESNYTVMPGSGAVAKGLVGKHTMELIVDDLDPAGTKTEAVFEQMDIVYNAKTMLESENFLIDIDETTGGIYQLTDPKDGYGTNYVMNPDIHSAFDIDDSRWVGDLVFNVKKKTDTKYHAANTSLSDDTRNVVKKGNAITVSYNGSSSHQYGIKDFVLEEKYQLNEAGDQLSWTIKVDNTSNEELTIADLGIPLLMNSWWNTTQDGIYEQNVARHSYVAKDGSYIYWQRPNGDGSFLVMTPQDGTSLEFKDKARFNEGPFAEKDPQWEGLVEYYIHSAEKSKTRPNAYLDATSLTLAKDQSKTYGFTFQWASSYADLRDILYNAGLVDIVSLPGMVIPNDMKATIAARSKDGIKREEGEGVNVTGKGTKNGYDLYEVSFSNLGVNYVTINYGNNKKSVMQYYSTKPVEELINANTDFLVKKQQAKVNYGYNGAYLQWDMKNKKLITWHDYPQSNIWSWKQWMAGGSDDLGLSPAVYLSEKNITAPDEDQIKSLEYYLENFIWGYMQQHDTYKVYRWYDGKEGTPSDQGTWRSYNYVHIANTYYNMYQIAKRYPEMTKYLKADQYLLRCYNTLKAYFTYGMFDGHNYENGGKGAYKFGNMGEMNLPEVLKALEAEGHKDEHADLSAKIKDKADNYLFATAYPFASEMSIDTTGFEACYTLAKMYGNNALVEKTTKASLACRGMQPLWYFYGSDNRHMGESWWNLGYETQLGAWQQQDYLYNYRKASDEDFDDIMRGTYGAYLAGWANINVGQISDDAANYGAASWQYQSEKGTNGYAYVPSLDGWWAWSGEASLGFWGGLKTASVNIVDDDIVGLYGYGCDLTHENGIYSITPKDGVRTRLTMYNEGNFGIAIDKARYKKAEIADDLSKIKLTLDMVEGVSPEITLNNLPEGNYRAVSSDGKVVGTVEREDKTATAVAKIDFDKVAANKEVLITTEVIKTGLQNLYNDNKDKNETDYTTTSWGAFDTALKAAETILGKAESTYEEVEKAEQDLTKAVEGLAEVAKTDDLQALMASYTEHSKKTQADYTAKTWEVFHEALTKAKAVLDLDDKDTSQAAVVKAKQDLENAAGQLIGTGDRETLNSQIARAKLEKEKEQLYQDLGLPKTWKAMSDALDEAEKIAANPKAGKSEVDAATEKLKDSLDVLEDRRIVKEHGDSLALQKAIEDAMAKDQSFHTATSWAAMQEKLDAAKKIREKEDAELAEVDKARDDLRDALNKLVPLDKTGLNAAIKRAEDEKNEEVYTAKSWKSLLDALDAAKVVAADLDASQDVVDNHTYELWKAIRGLEERTSVTKVALGTVIERAEKLLDKEDNYPATIWAEMQKAYDEAKKVQEDTAVSKEEVTAATLALRTALDELEANYIDRTGLREAIAYATELDRTPYADNQDGLAALDAALSDADQMMAEKDPAQADIDEATRKLYAAVFDLDPDTINVTGLGVAIKRAEGLDSQKDNYRASSWAELVEARQNAKDVYQRALENAATQQEVIEVTVALRKALRDLVSIDTYGLNAAIERANGLNKEDYEDKADAWDKMVAERQAAEEIIQKIASGEDDTITQKDIDAATYQLSECIRQLQAKTTIDKDELKVAIERTKAFDKNVYTKDSWEDLEKALDNASKVLADEKAAQTDVDAATKALRDAMIALEGANKSGLNTIINYANEVKEEDYTAESWAAMQDALNAVKEVSENPNATQQQINDASTRLSEALQKLERKAANKDVLRARYNEAKDIKPDGYTAESYAVLTKALAEAKAVLDKETATQSEVHAQTQALDDAIKALKKADAKPSAADKSRLQKKYTDTKAIKPDGYTAESYAALTKALTAAKAVLDKEDATQAEVDAQVNALDNAVKALKKAAVKVSKIKITGVSKKIASGKKIQLKAVISPSNATNKKVTWKSSNPKLATVDSKGLVRIKSGKGGRSVTITATAADGSGKKATYKIKFMKGVVKKVTISGKKSIKAGKKLQLKAKVTATKNANKKVKWTSSNTKYAKVNSKGKVTALKAGKGRKVKITAMATDGSGKKKTVTIKIK